MLRFTVARHDDPKRGIHDDWHFARPGGMLATWAIPILGTWTVSATAIRLPNHRSVYLDKQGYVAPNRGWTKPLVKGRYRTLIWTDQVVRLILCSECIEGIVELHSRRDCDLHSAENEHKWMIQLAAGAKLRI